MKQYTLIRSKRKTVALYVRNGELEVRAPLRTPEREIEKFVISKEKWITDKLSAAKERQEQRENFALTYGDYIVYRGREYPISVKDGNRMGFDGACFYMPQGLTPPQIKDACVRIYRMLAKRDLSAKTFEFAKKMFVVPSAVKINGAKTRWGSCSTKKSINFSWRLIMADDDVIDYVVVHELAHITEMNHSARFWAIVEALLPDYWERQKRLKELQRKLSVEDWELV